MALAVLLWPISGSNHSSQAPVLPPALKGHSRCQSLSIDPELAEASAPVCPVPAQGLGTAEQHSAERRLCPPSQPHGFRLKGRDEPHAKRESVLISPCCYWRLGVGSGVEGATKLDPLGQGLQVCYLHCAHGFLAASCSGVGAGQGWLRWLCHALLSAGLCRRV